MTSLTTPADFAPERRFPDSGAYWEPPTLPGGLPLLGHTLGFVRDVGGLLRHAWQECGDIVKVRVAGKTMVLLTGPRNQELFFRAPDEQLSQREPYQMMVPIFGRDVCYDASPERMTEQLKMLLLALQGGRMRGYTEIFAEEVERSVADWGDEGVVDFYEYAQRLTGYTSTHCFFGPEFRHEMTDEFARVYHQLERSLIPLAYINPRLPIPQFWRRDRARRRLGEMVEAIVERRRQAGTSGSDLFQHLMEARYADGTRLTNHEITGLLVATMFAGHHTSSVTASWTLLELLQHPHELAKVRGELSEVYGADGPVTYKSLRRIDCTERAIRETLRLHPPLFLLVRAVLQDFLVDGYRIPKGSWVLASPLVAHQDERIYREADRFDPDRLAAPREEDRRPFSYISFGGGRHRCMGNAFALLQLKAILAILLRRYEFSLFGDPVETDFSGIVAGPKQPCRVRYRRL